ncbi:hypothetical protein SAMN02910265_01252 [Ruminococcus flavefaciens]|uniref:Uncharacterized protein n=2 Tax=Ruminococcus flavefaciens TaxID=1265 RepID=A0A1H6IZG5_RUMFL|nr:hypothetical protein SAMN02910265_01252 [Ruminococcus flavefaciens]
MTMNECDIFFKQIYEKDINKHMLFYAYEFPSSEVLKYIDKLIRTPLKEFVDYIDVNNSHELIESKDVFQFSNFNDATFKLSQIIVEQGNPGLSYLDIGKLLLNDGKSRTEGAYVKYGENHAKTSSAIGLSFEMSHITFVSCIGMVINNISKLEKEKLLVRLLLRNKLIWRMYSATRIGSVNARLLFNMLSDSTYKRRKSNLLTILKILKNCSEYDFSSFVENVNF